MRNSLKLATALAAGALVLAGCGSSSSSAAPGGSSAPSGSSPAASSIKVGMAYDIGGRGDKSFNDSAAAGLDKAKAEFGVETKELAAVAGETDQQRAARLTLLAQGGYNPVIAVGFVYAGAVKTVAAKFPNTNFAIIDDSSNLQPNVANLVFAANQGSYIVGVIAAQAATSGKIGFIGGVNVPLIQAFQAGFDAGVVATAPSAKLTDKYLTQPPDFTGFTSPDKGQTAAQGLYDDGAEIIFAAAGSSGNGVFKAAKAAGKMAIGVDSDQYLSATADVKDVILTSALKRIDTAVYDFIKSAVDGSTLTGVQTFDLSNDGVGYSKSNPAVQPYEAKADEAIAAIIAGTITVPDKVS